MPGLPPGGPSCPRPLDARLSPLEACQETELGSATLCCPGGPALSGAAGGRSAACHGADRAPGDPAERAAAGASSWRRRSSSWRTCGLMRCMCFCCVDWGHRSRSEPGRDGCAVPALVSRVAEAWLVESVAKAACARGRKAMHGMSGTQLPASGPSRWVASGLRDSSPGRSHRATIRQRARSSRRTARRPHLLLEPSAPPFLEGRARLTPAAAARSARTCTTLRCLCWSAARSCPRRPPE
jgi:hypothetical protein